MRLQGYPFVILSLLIAIVWGLKVTYLCSIRVTGPGQDREQQMAAELHQILSLPHINIIERFFEDLGLSTVRLDGTGNIEWPELDTVFILGNEGNKTFYADEEFWRRAYSYATRTGARLVYIPPEKNGPSLSPIDMELGPLTKDDVVVVTCHDLPLFNNVKTCNLGRAMPIVSLSTPTVRLLRDKVGRVFGVIRRAGRGEIVVISAPQIGELKVIGREDNGLLLASLALRHSGKWPISKEKSKRDELRNHAPIGFVFIDSKARELMISAAQKVKDSWANEDRNKPLLTLWSIIVANPECIVLLQLLFVTIVYLLANKELNAEEQPLEPASADAFLRGFEGMCLRVPCERLLLPGCSRYFRTNLATRLGLPEETTSEDLFSVLRKLNPAYAKDYERLNQELQDISLEDSDVTPPQFINLMRRMDRILMAVSK